MVTPAMQLAGKISDVHVQLWASSLLKGKAFFRGFHLRRNSSHVSTKLIFFTVQCIPCLSPANVQWRDLVMSCIHASVPLTLWTHQFCEIVDLILNFG